MKAHLFFLIIFLTVIKLQAQTAPKGVLTEIQSEAETEEQLQKKSFQSEVLIIKSETKAIETLKNIIRKKKNTPEEVDYLFRLAELYMRRSKSGRFFDLNQSHLIKLKQVGLEQESAKNTLTLAVRTYEEIARRFPRFSDLDIVYFNLALAYAQQNKLELAHERYTYLVRNFPNSYLVPDALLEAGEINYQRQRFQLALSQFKEIEKYPQSKAYPYGLYKSAWAHYNLKQSSEAIDQLLAVLKLNPVGVTDKSKYNLRQESLRDLTLFVGETIPPEQIIGFFAKVTNEKELGVIIFNTAKLYESYSRHKEISIFADEFIKKYARNEKTPEIFSQLIQTQETLKNRSLVIKKLTDMAELCRRLSADNPNCLTEFKIVSQDITQKWWDIWLKNKKHAEFSGLTEKAFEILLSVDSPETPDFRSRYAYAELKFQLNKWLEAQKQYETVSLQKTADAEIKHNALYGALYSIEKILAEKESPDWIERQKQLALRYVEEFKTGEHVAALTLKLASIAYSQTQYELALTYLQKLDQYKLTTEQNLKSEDMQLDIHNLKKDYVTLIAELEKMKKKTQTEARRAQLGKLLMQAEFAKIQSEEAGLEKQKHIDALMAYAEKYKGLDLGMEAHWQAVSLAFASGFDFTGASLSEKFYREYPKDKRSSDALKEAVKVYTDTAHLEKAVALLKILVATDGVDKKSLQKNICELEFLNENVLAAKTCYIKLMQNAPVTEKAHFVRDYFVTFKLDRAQPTFDQLDQLVQQEISKYGIEPYATHRLIAEAQKTLDAGKDKEAFSMSLRINARPVDESVRAGARLIQAQILEKEFRAQSVKAREDKLTIVLAMKAEKMDKSLTAYNSALKMSKDPNNQISALLGIGRLYAHFIEAIENINLPETMSEADQKAVRTELSQLVLPFKEKYRNNQAQLTRLNAAQESGFLQTLIQTSSDKTPEPSLNPRLADQFQIYVYTDLNEYEPLVGTAKKCVTKNYDLPEMFVCLKAKKFNPVKEIGLKLAQNKKTRAQALFNLAVAAHLENNPARAAWLIEKSKAQHKLELALYQQAMILTPVEGLSTYFKNIDEIFDNKINIQERIVLRAAKAFSERDFKAALQEFSRLSLKQNYTYGVDIIYLESLLQTKKIEEAKSALAELKQLNPDRVELQLQEARLYELFALDQNQALKIYKQALEKAQDIRIKNWINKKLDFLTDNKTQLTSNVGGQ